MTTGKQKYFEKYKDPRWQKMRLEIMERDEFACRVCCDKESTLHVHHCYYEWGKDPWDYQKSSLITLCEVCHQDETEALKGEKKLLLDVLSLKGATSSDLNMIAFSMHESTWFADRIYEQDLIAISEFFRDQEIYEIAKSRFFLRTKTKKTHEGKSD